MFHWIAIAVIGYLFYALANITEKMLRTRNVHAFSLTILLGIAMSLFLLLVPFRGIAVPALSTGIVAILAGAVRILAFFFYARALMHEEVSRVVPLWSLAAVFTLLLAFTFLGERLPPLFYVAFVLLSLGGALITVRNGTFHLKNNTALHLMLLSSFLYGAQAVLIKFVYTQIAFLDGFLWIAAGTALATLLPFLSPTMRDYVRQDIFSGAHMRFIVPLVALSASSILLVNLAIMLGPVSIVEALSGTQFLFVLLFATLLSRFAPHLLEEVVTVRHLTLKLVAIVLIIAGLAFLHL